MGSPRGENNGNYNITQSFEFGYRWSLIGGDLGEYRSVVNYRQRPAPARQQLLGEFQGRPRPATSTRSCSTPWGSATIRTSPSSLRIQKNSLYRYDMSWRLNDYYNPGPDASPAGLHLHRDTEPPPAGPRSDPASAIAASASASGYSRNVEDGPALSTAQEFDVERPGPAGLRRCAPRVERIPPGRRRRIRRLQTDGDPPLGFLQGRQSLQPDRASPAPLQPTTDLTQSEPVRARRADPRRESRLARQSDHAPQALGVNARADLRQRQRATSSQNEVAFGTSQFGGAASRADRGRRQRQAARTSPAISRSTSSPPSSLTVVNNTSIISNRITGTSSYSEVRQRQSTSAQTINFRYLGIRTVTNSTDVNYRVNKWLGVLRRRTTTPTARSRPKTASALPAIPNSAVADEYQREQSPELRHARRPLPPVEAVHRQSGAARSGARTIPLTPVSEKHYHTSTAAPTTARAGCSSPPLTGRRTT